ncbi:tRNA wybutosine-synthesizing 4 [Brachionus plicatilis]|uniref:Leucine carboxyl methyltransferase 1 n=1 Tax=Brachionus plicatilis TaxID=10195 RepID=A0A3M7RCA3_BRAPC|nr:tRNA wybutosine-synthesizing 4 [Brachionus plicatilis]
MEEAFKINQKSPKIRNDSAVQGYYIRAKMIDYTIKGFLNQISTKKQIVNLGAGFDSTFFRLKDQSLLDNALFIEINKNFVTHEHALEHFDAALEHIDFPDVINRKISLIKNNQILSNMCQDLVQVKEINGNKVYQSLNSNLLIIGIDLRNTELLEAILKSVSLYDENAPTIFLSEVVMTYMSVKSCNGLLKWISETFSNCFLAVYEQINPFDPFGQVMCSHFAKLGSPLKCILKYPFEYEQKNRYEQMIQI